MPHHWVNTNIFLAGLILGLPAHATVTVTQPTASTVVEAGDDFATQVLGNAWDMSDAIDVDTQESVAYFTGLTISGGMLTGSTATTSSGLFPLYPGLNSTINLSRGANFPIDTTHYRYLTIKIKDSVASPFYAYFFPTANNSVFGVTNGFALPANQWAVISIDMVSNLAPSSAITWTQQSSVMGLRIDPAEGASGVGFNVDWMRLTAPATAAQKTTVTWSDSGSATTYSIIAIDNAGAGTAYTLKTGVSGTSVQADTSLLAPGQYVIQVKRADSTFGNSAIYRINSPAQVTLTAPSAAGDVSKDFATTVVGNAWGPFAAIDFQTIGNFTNVVYNNPAGSFYGRPTNGDPGWYFNLGGHTIDTGLYRSLCIDQEVLGTRSVGLGSVARVFWGNAPASLTTSQDIVLDDNQNNTVVGHYCLRDLAVVPLEASPNGGTWSGTKSQLRIDPDEFAPPGGCSTPSACHDVRLDKVTLSPFAQANPGYTFQWTLADADNASETIALYLDPDTDPNNGNEILIHSASTATGSGSYAWPGSMSATYGTYNVLIVADDGMNSVSQYAGGQLIVGVSDGIFRNGFDTP